MSFPHKFTSLAASVNSFENSTRHYLVATTDIKLKYAAIFLIESDLPTNKDCFSSQE